MNFSFKTILFSLVAILIISCGGEKADEKKTPEIVQKKKEPYKPVAPYFSADSAYDYIKRQVMFGPRVPNTEPAKKCAAWLEKKLKESGMTVIVQKGEVTAFNDKKLQISNIMGQFKPELKDRILLFAHWDTRPWADSDTINENKPIDGANDGGSGVGVLLEIARIINASDKKPEIGIDILFVDAEDYGQPSNTMMLPKRDTWCLGTQYWAKNIPVPGYKPRYGILLDMVGAKNAQFPVEAKSSDYAPEVVSNVWNTASDLGYSSFFPREVIDFVGSDDHVYMTQLAGIRSIDIIQYDYSSGGFGEYHHTHADNMDIIDKSTLKAVGQTLLEVVYKEKGIVQ